MEELREFQTEESFDLKYYLYKFLDYWYVFPVALLICLSIAFYKNKNTPKIYNVRASLLIRQEQSAMDLKSILPENLISSSTLEDQRIYNEIGALKSYKLTRKTIKKLDFETAYFKENTFADNELYHSAPFRIVFDSSHVQPLGTKIYLESIGDNRFRISIKKDDASIYNFSKEKITSLIPEIHYVDTVSYHESINTNFCKFRVVPGSGELKSEWDSRYYFIFQSYGSLVKKYQGFDVEASDKSTILNLSLNTPNVQKGTQFLNTLIDLYLEQSVGKKNEVANKTVTFIDDQIDDIADSLSQSEKKLESFRSSQQLMDLGILTQNSYDRLNQLQNEKAEILIKLKYFDYLINYLKEEQDVQQLAAPSSMGIDDKMLVGLIDKLSELYSEKSDIEINTKRENPYLSGLNQRIAELKKTLIESVGNLVDKNHIRLNDIESQISELTERVSQLPVKERQLFAYERKFELYNTLYTFLLKKRSETEIGKAANIPVHEVLDEARLANNSPVSPQQKKNYLVAILLGFLIPGGIIVLKDYFNDKITDLATIEHNTEYPVLGNLSHKKEDTENIVYNFPKSLVAETFRSIRTNFQFITGGEKVTTVLISSATQGEGKSFVSINLATSFAMYKRKTVLVSFDLRRPNIYNLFNIKDKQGLSNYLSNNCNLEDIIYKTNIEKLDVIPAGHIPPNPSELIASETTARLFEKLKRMYEYIIIDTPPAGLVTDAFLLVKYTNSNLFVVRHNYTRKKMFESLVKNLKQKNIRNVNFIVNDITLKSRGYEYNYGYNYNYSYYS